MHDAVFKLINHQLTARPAMQVEDIYKLLYQSCMGLGHLLNDKEKALQYLLTEFSQLEQKKNSALESEPLMEDITLKFPLLRINLRPFILSSTWQPEQLFSAMLDTEKQLIPSSEDLVSAWKSYIILEKEHAFLGKRCNLYDFDQYLKKENYPVQHHSPAYRFEYAPSYRIIGKTVFQRMIGSE